MPCFLDMILFLLLDVAIFVVLQLNILSQLDVIKAVFFHKADKNREHNYLLNLIPTYLALYSKFIFVSPFPFAYQTFT